MNVRRIAAAAAAGALTVALSACSAASDDVPNTDGDLVIGVSGSSPGLALVNTDGSFTGFEVDLAAYLAKNLGWNERQITFRMVAADEREQSLADGSVDMVVSAYAITAERDELVDFAGPYFIAGQDLLVAQGSPITGPRSLDGQSVCGTRGSAGLALIETADYSPGALPREAATDADCVDLLLEGRVDAVTGDDVVLAGYADRDPDELQVVGSPFTTEYYGVGLPDGSPDVAVINDLIGQAVDDGTWQADFDRHLGDSGYTAPLPPVPGTAVS